MKNLIACTSFLVEQKLAKEWLVDKDAEALRCQKFLVEEEEAAQERRRLKKLRQKEKRAKEHVEAEESDLEGSSDSLEVSPSFASTNTQATCSSKSRILETL